VIELASEEEDWNQKPGELIAYLRDGAKLLEGDLSSKRFFIENEYPTRSRWLWADTSGELGFDAAMTAMCGFTRSPRGVSQGSSPLLRAVAPGG
jgi:hypothetical protein